MAHGLALGVLDDVGVDVHGDADLGVAEDLHHDAGRHPGRREESGRSVAVRMRWMTGTPAASRSVFTAVGIVSELSTNAIRHTASGVDSGLFHLAVAVSAQVIAGSVTDDGDTGTAPKIEHQDHAAEHGRGLGMVSALAHRVVVHSSYTVTAELYADPRRGGRSC